MTIGTMRVGDALRLVAVEQRLGCVAGQHGLQLPGEIDGVADAGIHALAAGGTMDMRRITG